MVLSMIVPQSDDDLIDSTFASRYVNVPLARFKLPETSIPKEAAYQIISDELTLDGRPRLNLASTISTWMEPECDKLISEAINKNFANMDEYPVTAELQNRCVNIIARLFNAPCGIQDSAFGVATIGSSEAAMLAGLAYKYKWQQKRKGKPYVQPNFVAGANVHVCWKKFALYFDVEFREVKLSEGYYVMDPQKAVEMVDENTIFVTAIFGSTLTGEFEDVKELNELLAKKNNQKGWDIPIHVDAASGGFVAPFLYPDIEWDFRLPLVKSINVSGHKYGLVYAGIGWAIWRCKKDLPNDLFFDISSLGGHQPTFTFNFTKGACQVLAQYYQLIRLGRQGYNKIMKNCQGNAMILKDAIEKIGYFNILSKDVGVPVVTISLKDRSKFNEFDVSKVLRRYGWMVDALNMAKDADNVTVIRVAVREDFSRNQVVHFVEDIRKVLKDLNPSKASSRDGIVAVNKSTATNGVC